MMKRNLKLYSVMLIMFAVGGTSCKKLISIPEPTGSITTTKVFATDAQATSAMAGIYTRLINGNSTGTVGLTGFSTGMCTIFGGMSGNELVTTFTNNSYYTFNANKLISDEGNVLKLWTTAYDAVYGANAVIEGIEASTSGRLHDDVRKRLTAEAKFIRAFAYFYLVNFFEEVPLALTVDFNKTVNIRKTPKAEVYKQILKDLEEAKPMLSDNFSAAGGDRILPTKWAATALLARVYLYTADYAKANAQATEVINQSSLFKLTEDLNDVFLIHSQEAIWQLQQSNQSTIGNATPEGYTVLGNKDTKGGLPLFPLSEELKNDFETKDQRKITWCWTAKVGDKIVYYPYKYKVGLYNSTVGGSITEYYMVLRLAEQYLIRAEAQALGNLPLGPAIADLNVIRHRAGLDDLSLSLSKAEVITAIEHEREIELFAEWGHRFLDLKRTGRAHDVLSAVPIKQPWTGDYQLTYPIPRTEVIANQKLIQNPGY